jgi:hypothetical protein
MRYARLPDCASLNKASFQDTCAKITFIGLGGSGERPVDPGSGPDGQRQKELSQALTAATDSAASPAPAQPGSAQSPRQCRAAG